MKRTRIRTAAVVMTAALLAATVGTGAAAAGDDQDHPANQSSDAEWEAYDQCLTDNGINFNDDPFGDLPLDDTPEPTDEEHDALDAQWEAADEACKGLLPAEIQAMDAEWEAYDQCLTDNGINFNDDPFGDLPLDDTPEPTDEEHDALDAQWEAADQACESLAPEDAFIDDEWIDDEWIEFDAEWEAYDQCLADNGVDYENDPFANGAEPTDEELDALDAQWEAAEQACDPLTPQGLVAEA